MIYVINTFSDTLMIIAVLLFNSIVSNNNVKIIRFLMAVIVFAIMSITIVFCNTQGFELYYWIALIIYPLRYSIVLCIMYGKILCKNVYIILFYEFMIYILISSTTNLLENVIEIPCKLLSSTIAFLFNAIAIVILGAFNKKIRNLTNQIKNIIPRHIYILVLLAVICLCGLSTLNNYSTDNIAAKENIMNLIIVLFTFIIGYIIISLLVNVISKQHFRSTTAMLQNQVEIQIRHYDKLEKLNNEMRSFRHDYANHLYSLHSLIEMNESCDALVYIEKLLETKHRSLATFTTGNKLADAILTDKADTLSDNIRIDYQGIVPSSIDNVDLCTILSNVLDNAIEACSKLSSPSIISINALERQGYFVLTITNPTECTDVFSDIPMTTKADSEHHGMGLMNIQDVVKKYDGQMKVHCENQIFELSVAIKM